LVLCASFEQLLVCTWHFVLLLNKCLFVLGTLCFFWTNAYFYLAICVSFEQMLVCT
jgi:hypothetical protein